MPKDHSFKVVIVGAGLGGLLLALQLERSNIDYVVVERNAQALMPIEGGGVIFIKEVVQTLLDQLGLLDRVLDAAGRVRQAHVKEYTNGKMTHSLVLQHDSVAITRPDLYNILIQQIPQAKLELDKTMVRVEQDEQSVRCYCIASDGSSPAQFSGDILVGADGTYSAVRLHMLRKLREQGTITEHDRQPMMSDCIRLVGQATELDPSALPNLPAPHECDIQVSIHKGEHLSYTTWAVTFPKGNVTWMIDQKLAEPEICPDLEDLTYHADLVKAMCDDFRALPCAWGLEVPHELLFKATLPNTIGRLGRETKVYDSWNLGRLVLMGDACHKALPYWGDPLAQAALDGIALHKVLSALILRESIELKDIEDGFENYKQERKAEASRAVQSSRKLDE